MNYAHPTPELERVLQDVADERKRQVAKGWTPDHDDDHSTGAMRNLARRRLGWAALALEGGATERLAMVQAISILVSAVESMDRRAAR